MLCAPHMTHHASDRSRTRKIPEHAIDAALIYGACRRARGAEVYVIRWRDVCHWRDEGVDLSAFEGVQVVCSHGGQVLTVYRRRRTGACRARSWRQAA